MEKLTRTIEPRWPEPVKCKADQRLYEGQDRIPCGSSGTSCKCQKTEICMVVQACYAPRQTPQNHPSWCLGGWATP